MNITILSLFFTSTFSVFGQDVPNYEQIAFDYYRINILTNDKHKGKLTLWTEIKEDGFLRWYTGCLDNFDFNKTDQILLNASGSTKIDLVEDRRFKIKKWGTGSYPRISVTASFSNNENQHIVTIFEVYKHSGLIYYIELDDDGEIKNWCNGGWI